MSTAMTLRRGISAAALLAAASLVFAQSKPPVAPVKEIVDTYFGATVADPYRYMEDMKNPEVSAWMKAQADYTRAALDKIPQRAELLKEVAKYGDAAAARISSLQVVGDMVYYLKRNANENIAKLYVRRGFAGKERLLVDPDKQPAPEGKHNAIDYYQPSPDNKYLAFGISVGGSEESVIHVLEVATAKETGDVIDRANFATPSFLPDGRLVYSRLQKLAPDAPSTDKYQNQKTFVHALGTNPDNDAAILGAGVSPAVTVAPAELVVAGNPIGSKYMIGAVVNGVQREIRLYVAPRDALAGDKTPWVKLTETADDVTDIAVHGDWAYLLTHKNASRFKVLRVSLAKPDIGSAEVAVPESESVVTGLAAAKDALYVQRMNAGISELLRLDYEPGAKAAMIKLPFDGDISALASDQRVAGVVVDMSAWTKFGGYYAYEPKAGKFVDTKLQPQSKYDNPQGLVSTEVKVKAADGTMVPLSIVHRKGIKLDGSNPTVLYGYGAYGISETPFYRPTFLPWFERGGVFAVAHVRGGGENGEAWYKAGYKLTKPNTWNDAIACAEWLIANKYTSSAKLGIWGGSAGGIFVGRSITDRPDLFAAAIDDVPVSDAVRMELSPNGVPNIPEFGTVKTEDGFKGLLAMSSYHHVKDGTKYPAVMLVTGFNDPRVDSWEAGKMTARLQAALGGDRPILLRIDYDAGHGFGSTKKSQYEERADTFAFMFWQFGVKGFQPGAN